LNNTESLTSFGFVPISDRISEREELQSDKSSSDTNDTFINVIKKYNTAIVKLGNVPMEVISIIKI